MARFQGSLVLTLFNIVLLMLLIISGFYTAKHINSRVNWARAVSETTYTHNQFQSASRNTNSQSLNSYQMIWKRALFDVSENKLPNLTNNAGSIKSPIAKIDLGLKLVGTVVSDDPSLNRALIDNLTAQSQGIYSVGNRIDHIMIKKILNDRVIVNAGHGDEVLLMRGPMIASAQFQTDVLPVAQAPIDQRRMGSRHRTVTLSREAVASALSNIDKALDNVYISSGKVINRLTGFRITSFEKDTIFSRLGLRNGDLVLSVNDQKFNSPEEAKTFFQKIRDGGSLDVKVRRRARTNHIHINIQ